MWDESKTHSKAHTATNIGNRERTFCRNPKQFLNPNYPLRGLGSRNRVEAALPPFLLFNSDNDGRIVVVAMLPAYQVEIGYNLRRCFLRNHLPLE